MTQLGNAAWGFRETPLEEQLRITRDMGLKLLELSIAGHENDYLQLNASAGEIAAVAALFDKYGIELNCAATGGDFTLPRRDDNLACLARVKQVIDICRKLGVRYLRIFAGFSPVEEVVGNRWRTMIECLRETGEYAAAVGVTPVIETHGGITCHADGVTHFFSASSEPDTLVRMLDELPLTLMVNFDPANLYAVGIEHPETVYKRIRERVAYVHFKDFVTLPGTGRLKPAACGESDMDWDSLLAAMAGYSGPVLIEYENIEDIEDGYRRSLEFLRKHEITAKPENK
ncbi:MAG: sugar phosphate isomerase/epimerase [Victivallales bacterium]|nr:sugar phosphate isomerase/epimerase [Victivallales bacterium]